MKFVKSNTDYGVYRELLKEGNKIIGWIEQRTMANIFMLLENHLKVILLVLSAKHYNRQKMKC